MKYRKKPVEVEALQWTGDNAQAIRDFLREATYGWSPVGDGWLIYTREGVMTADPGDWIIRGVTGEFYPCKDPIFRATYEPVEP